MSWSEGAGALFDEWAEAGRGESMARGHERLAGAALDALEPGTQARLLDLGCGVGRALELAQERYGCALAGIDVAAAMIERARARVPAADLHHGSVDALPFADAAFSHVVSVEAIYYFEDPLAVFREVARVLQAGGRVALALELFEENPGTHVWRDQLSIPVHLLAAEQWCDHLRGAGFVDVRHERIRCHDDKTWSPSPYFPSEELFAAYVREGALLLTGRAPA
ncbi:MAG TPA: class I SAM-dependent methyltransferase [Planctomycetes bacterium]|nr:class I SAM-dependent methyltransferase [Planctomycetota bacterium]